MRLMYNTCKLRSIDGIFEKKPVHVHFGEGLGGGEGCKRFEVVNDLNKPVVSLFFIKQISKYYQ